MKKLFIGIMLVAVILTFMQSLEFRNGNMQNNLDIISFSSSLAQANPEVPPPQKFDKTKSNCVRLIEGEVGITGTWMNIPYTIPASGSITLTCVNCDIDCPTGTVYLRVDCTTKDCG
jgi:hypothetical protein